MEKFQCPTIPVPVYIAKTLSALEEHLKKHPVGEQKNVLIGWDTEFGPHPSQQGRHQLQLLQIATARQILLIPTQYFPAKLPESITLRILIGSS